MQKRYVIYKHTNKTNGKSYIGQTSKNPERRWSSGLGYKSCPNFYAAIQKYGWNNFTHEIIEKDLTEDEVDEREIYWINFYNSVNNGYNISSGGCGNHNFSEEHKKNLQKSVAVTLGHPVICLNTGKIYNSINEAYRDTGANHIEQCCTGILKTAGKDKDGIALVWRYLKDYNPKEIIELKPQKRGKTKIRCINTGVIYDSTKQASTITGVDGGSISKCLNGKRKSAGKDENGNPLIWEFVE